MDKKSALKKITGSREILLVGILILLFAAVTVISPSFLTPKSIMDMLKNNAVTMVMALGMLCVMLVGGIDISIMSTLALSGMSVGMLLKYEVITSPVLAFLISVTIGTVCGLLVGLVISRANVPPIIATMGFMYVFRAMGYLVSNGGEWAGAAALGSFKDFATTKFLGINCVIWVIILCYVFFYFFMKWTRTGRKIYAE
ncbi:MAG: ABC transporter permease, partial [Clostridiales bacterium]|nr:ABC transporter permease [Clostridiales bacterium]